MADFLMSDSNSKKVLKIHLKDNCLVALEDLQRDEAIQFEGRLYLLSDVVKVKHKFSLVDLDKDGIVYQYGIPVAKARQSIRAGESLTVKNVIHYANENFSYRAADHLIKKWQAPDVSTLVNASFQGYKRADDRVGTRNHWLVIPLVFCQNGNLMTLRNIFLKALGYEKKTSYQMQLQELIACHQQGCDIADYISGRRDKTSNLTMEPEEKIFPNVDGVKFLFHSAGCGETNQDSELLCKLLASYVDHPNVFGATILSLGCQKAQIKLFQQKLQDLNPNFNKPLYIFDQQTFEIRSDAYQSSYR